MATFTYDHIHLRSPNPEATAAFYERMFGAEVIRTEQQGKPRIDHEDRRRQCLHRARYCPMAKPTRRRRLPTRASIISACR